MATKAEDFDYFEQRSGPKKPKRVVKRERPGRPGRSEMPRILESSRTRGQDIRVNRLPVVCQPKQASRARTRARTPET